MYVNLNICFVRYDNSNHYSTPWHDEKRSSMGVRKLVIYFLWHMQRLLRILKDRHVQGSCLPLYLLSKGLAGELSPPVPAVPGSSRGATSPCTCCPRV